MWKRSPPFARSLDAICANIVASRDAGKEEETDLTAAL